MEWVRELVKRGIVNHLFIFSFVILKSAICTIVWNIKIAVLHVAFIIDSPLLFLKENWFTMRP